MRTIHKYPLSPVYNSINMPRGAKVLCIQVQEGSLYIWAEVENTEPVEARQFRTYGTGFQMPDVLEDYVGTFQLLGLVFHVYEEKSV